MNSLDRFKNMDNEANKDTTSELTPLFNNKKSAAYRSWLNDGLLSEENYKLQYPESRHDHSTFALIFFIFALIAALAMMIFVFGKLGFF